MSVALDQIRALLKELVIESLRGIDWSDVGFSADDEVRYNRLKPNFRKDISLVALVDPTSNPMDLVAPASSANQGDPLFMWGDEFVQIPVTWTKKTTPVPIQLSGRVGQNGTAAYATLETPVGTDYTVPTGKTLWMTKFIASYTATGVDTEFGIGYGDNGVADGTTAPTNIVRVLGTSSVNTSPFKSGATANAAVEHKASCQIPAGKLPCMFRPGNASGGNVELLAWGIEVDA